MIVTVTVISAMGCEGKREKRVCKHLTELCGDAVPSSCAANLDNLKDKLGASYDSIMTCAVSATSCPEITGCFAGGFGQAFARWADKFAAGAQRAFGAPAPAPHAAPTPRATPTPTPTPTATPGCQRFEGNPRWAVWDDCADHARRQVTCEPTGNDLKCSCVVDGVTKGSFNAIDPPLYAQDAATRVARANCAVGGFDKL